MYVSIPSADKLDLTTERVYNLDDPVELPSLYIGQTRPVCCYKFSLPKSMAQRDIPRVNHLLYKMEGNKIKTVKIIRYYYQNGCLQIDRIQENDNGNYRLLLKTCLSSRTVSTINFALLIVSSGNSIIILQSTFSSFLCSNPYQYHLLLHLHRWFTYKYNVVS